MRILALDAALGRCSAALLIDDAVVAEPTARRPSGRGRRRCRRWPPRCWPRPACGPTALDAVAATVGPGSFTGLRAALALAQGCALAPACPVSASPWRRRWPKRRRARTGGRSGSRSTSRRQDRVFLAAGDGVRAVPMPICRAPPARWRWPATPRRLVAAWLAARGADVTAHRCTPAACGRRGAGGAPPVRCGGCPPLAAPAALSRPARRAAARAAPAGERY